MPQHLHLIPIDSAFERALASETGTLLLRYRVYLGEVAPLVEDVVRQTLSMPPAVPPWGGYLAFEEVGRMAVGTCAFKGAPDADGVVEIAYYTFPPFEGRGFATAMAARLLEIAWGDSRVRSAVAHTRPESNASTRILEKLGFARDGEVLDPEDGAVWRWGRARPGTIRARPPVPIPA